MSVASCAGHIKSFHQDKASSVLCTHDPRYSIPFKTCSAKQQQPSNTLLRFRCTTENKFGLESKYFTQSYLLFYQPQAGEANSKMLISSGTNYKLAILCSNETICAIRCASKIPNLKPIEWLTAACPSPIGNATQPNQQCFQVLETEGIKWKSDPNMLHSKIKFNLHSSEKAFPYHQKCSSWQ